MKKGLCIPLVVLVVVLAFSLWNSHRISTHTDRLCAQLEYAKTLSQSEDWERVRSTLICSYEDWTAQQTYFHIVLAHDAIHDSELSYHRAMAFAQTREETEFLAELAALQKNLQRLAEMEQFSPKNIL